MHFHFLIQQCFDMCYAIESVNKVSAFYATLLMAASMLTCMCANKINQLVWLSKRFLLYFADEKNGLSCAQKLLTKKLVIILYAKTCIIRF
jgi:hypothetical protein